MRDQRMRKMPRPSSAFMLGFLLCASTISMVMLIKKYDDVLIEHTRTAVMGLVQPSRRSLVQSFESSDHHFTDQLSVRTCGENVKQLVLTDSNLENISLFYNIDVEREHVKSIDGGPMRYLPNYKNPCWMAKLTEAYPYRANGYGVSRYKNTSYPGGSTFDVLKTFNISSSIYAKRLQHKKYWRLRCLPYVYLVGVTKSGTSDLFENLIRHPDIIAGAMKEPFWWNRRRIGSEKKLGVVPVSLTEYIDLYDAAAEAIRTDGITGKHRHPYHPQITIDATPAYLWDYDGWQMIPGNKGLDEPSYTMAHSLHALVPQARIVAILRNPVDRLYSQFMMRLRDATAADFHDSAQFAVRLLNNCLAVRTLRSCVYDPTVVYNEFFNNRRRKIDRSVKHLGNVFLRASLYYVFITDWLAVFPRDQVLILHAEDYYADRISTLSHVHSFLGISPMSQSQREQLEKGHVVNGHEQTETRLNPTMLPETRTLLTNFYAPYNDLLAKLLNDDRFLWNQ